MRGGRHKCGRGRDWFSLDCHFTDADMNFLSTWTRRSSPLRRTVVSSQDEVLAVLTVVAERLQQAVQAAVRGGSSSVCRRQLQLLQGLAQVL